MSFIACTRSHNVVALKNVQSSDTLILFLLSKLLNYFLIELCYVFSAFFAKVSFGTFMLSSIFCNNIRTFLGTCFEGAYAV